MCILLREISHLALPTLCPHKSLHFSPSLRSYKPCINPSNATYPIIFLYSSMMEILNENRYKHMNPIAFFHVVKFTERCHSHAVEPYVVRRNNNKRSLRCEKTLCQYFTLLFSVIFFYDPYCHHLKTDVDFNVEQLFFQ